jgi:hypothetical protein
MRKKKQNVSPRSQVFSNDLAAIRRLQNNRVIETGGTVHFVCSYSGSNYFLLNPNRLPAHRSGQQMAPTSGDIRDGMALLLRLDSAAAREPELGYSRDFKVGSTNPVLTA